MRNNFTQRIHEAEAMIAAFVSVGGDNFDLTLKTITGEKRQFRRNLSAKRFQHDLAMLMETAERDCLSVIVRPHSKSVAFIQLDDIIRETALRLIPYSCCVLETSEGNYQAFIPLVGLDRAAKELARSALVEKTLADRGASGAARLAGSFNFKHGRQREDGTYPQVRLVSPGEGKVFSVPELVAAGLISIPLAEAPKPNLIRPKPPRRHIVPSYQRTIHYVRRKEDGSVDRSAVDLLFAVTCLDWQVSTEKTILLLEANSPKAAERYDDYAERTVVKAQRIIEKRTAKARRLTFRKRKNELS